MSHDMNAHLRVHAYEIRQVKVIKELFESKRRRGKLARILRSATDSQEILDAFKKLSEILEVHQVRTPTSLWIVAKLLTGCAVRIEP